MSTTSEEESWRELARWAAAAPRPRPPETLPGLDAFNAILTAAYRERLVAWKVGRAEALLRGLE